MCKTHLSVVSKGKVELPRRKNGNASKNWNHNRQGIETSNASGVWDRSTSRLNVQLKGR